jgi:hypothetical protein
MPFSRNDRHDTDRRELKLIRVGHYLWALYKKSDRMEAESRRSAGFKSRASR